MAEYRDDARELADRINHDIEGVIHKHFPQAIIVVERGKRVALLTPRIKSPTKVPTTKGKKKSGSRKPTSSFKVHLDGADRGKWFRFSAGVGGWGLQLLYYIKHDRLADGKSDWAEAYHLAREHLGISQERQITAEEKADRDARRAAQGAERERQRLLDAEVAAQRREQRTMNAMEVCEETVPLIGTHGDAYLQARGIAPVADWPWDCSDTIRFHPGLVSELDPSAGRFPAVICKVVDPFGSFTGIWQIFLDPVKPIKAALDNPKVGRGPVAGGAIRLGGDADDIQLSEGFETACAAWELEHYRRPSWSLMSTSGMISFEPPVFVKIARTWPDGDRGKLTAQRTVLEPPGMKAALTMQKRLVAVGIRNPINEMTRHGDALDMLVARKAFDATRQEPAA